MGVYIKGMEMPKYGCDHCFLRTGNYCGRIEKDESVVEYARRNDRHPDCPLVPVPPHGRLIDADALEMNRRAENAKKGWHDSFAVVFNGDPYYEAVYDCTEQFKELVNNAPTIIPSSGGKENE